MTNHVWAYGGTDRGGKRYRACECCGAREHWPSADGPCPPDLTWHFVLREARAVDRDAERQRAAAPARRVG